MDSPFLGNNLSRSDASCEKPRFRLARKLRFSARSAPELPLNRFSLINFHLNKADSLIHSPSLFLLLLLGRLRSSDLLILTDFGSTLIPKTKTETTWGNNRQIFVPRSIVVVGRYFGNEWELGIGSAYSGKLVFYRQFRAIKFFLSSVPLDLLDILDIECMGIGMNNSP